MESRWGALKKVIISFLEYIFSSKGGNIKTGDIKGSPTIINLNKPKDVKIYVTPPYKEITDNPYLEEVIEKEFSPESKDHSVILAKEGYLTETLAYKQTPLTDIQKEIVKNWRMILPRRYIGALILSYRIINLENELSNYCHLPANERVKEIGKMITESRKKLYLPKYEYRRKIYNFARSGYIEGYLGAVLGELWATDIYLAKEKFPSFFEKSLNFFEPAIWVDYNMSEDELLTELRKRLKQERPLQVTIYTRGKERITMVENLIDVLFKKRIQQQLDFSIYPQSKDEYLIGCTPAASFTITNSIIKLD